MRENFEGIVGRRSRDEEQESISESNNMDVGSSDDQDVANNPPRKKRYHRHTPQQIQELEVLFKVDPLPDDKQKLELSRRIGLETSQVSSWFKNRNFQQKIQRGRHENSLLRQENDKLRAENMPSRDAMRNPICTNCGGPAIIRDISLEEQPLRIEIARLKDELDQTQLESHENSLLRQENDKLRVEIMSIRDAMRNPTAIIGNISLEEQHVRIEIVRLKDELDRVSALAGKFLGRPISSQAGSVPSTLPNSSLELAVGSNGFGGLTNVTTKMPLGPDFRAGISKRK